MSNQEKLASKMVGGEAAISASIVRNVKRGDAKSETLLIKRYQKGLVFMLRHHSNDPELADDIAQDTFSIVIERLRDSGIQSPEKLSQFLYSTAKNLLLGHYRKRNRRSTYPDTDKTERTLSSVQPADEVLHRKNMAKQVRRLLQELPNDRDREILTRFYFLGQEKDTICRTMNLSDVHFSRVIFRARQRMKKIIKDYENQWDITLL